MTKKILTISAIVLLVVALGLIYYYFFFARNNSTTQTTANTPTSGNLFPFGQGSTNTTTNNQTSNQQPTVSSQSGSYLQKLRLITNEPVAGATFVDTKTGIYIRYIEKATGHIFDVATNSTDSKQVSNTTIPKLYEAFFTEKGTSFIGRYLKDDAETIETVYGKIATTTSGTLLPEKLDSVSVSPAGTSILYIQKSVNGSTGIIASPNGGGKKQIWDSKIRSVLAQFAGENQIIITTKPNASVNGYAYVVNTKNGGVKNILQNFPDLSTLPNQTGTTILFYTSRNGGGLFTYSLINASTNQISPKTLPEKCVFDPNNKNILYCAVPKDLLTTTSLDDWYLGLVSFADDIWKYDLSKNTATDIENLSLDAGRDIDATNLQINSSSSILIFQSKTDGSLWSLNVSP